MDSSLRQLCQSHKQYPLLSAVAEICYSAPVTNAWPERGASAVKRIKTRYAVALLLTVQKCKVKFFFSFEHIYMILPSYFRLRSLLKDDMLNVLLQVSINGPTLAEADSIIQDATKVGAHYIVTFYITSLACPCCFSCPFGH